MAALLAGDRAAPGHVPDDVVGEQRQHRLDVAAGEEAPLDEVELPMRSAAAVTQGTLARRVRRGSRRATAAARGA